MSAIEKNVMASARLIYTMRMLTSVTALKLYVWALALYTIGRLVWVAHVWENLEKVGIGHLFQFMLAAVLNTQLLVQLALLIGAMALISFLVDVVRGLRTPTFA